MNDNRVTITCVISAAIILIATIISVSIDNNCNPIKPARSPKTPAIIIKMDYETVKRIDARLDAIDGVLTINGLIPAK